MKSITWLNMLALGVAGLVSFADARPGPPHGGPRGPWPDPHQAWMRALEDRGTAERLGLNEQERRALLERASASESKLITLRAEVEKAEAEVRRLMRQQPVDREALMRAIDQAGAAQTALRKAMVEEQLTVREQLGEERADAVRQRMREMRRDQLREHLREKRQEMREKWKEKREKERREWRKGGQETPPPAPADS